MNERSEAGMVGHGRAVAWGTGDGNNRQVSAGGHTSRRGRPPISKRDCTVVRRNLRRAALGPLPLLLVAEAFVYQLIRSRFHKAGDDSLTVAIPLSIVGNEGAIPADRWSSGVRLSSSFAF
jgi:hypothetical protein